MSSSQSQSLLVSTTVDETITSQQEQQQQQPKYWASFYQPPVDKGWDCYLSINVDSSPNLPPYNRETHAIYIFFQESKEINNVEYPFIVSYIGYTDRIIDRLLKHYKDPRFYDSSLYCVYPIHDDENSTSNISINNSNITTTNSYENKRKKGLRLYNRLKRIFTTTINSNSSSNENNNYEMSSRMGDNGLPIDIMKTMLTFVKNKPMRLIQGVPPNNNNNNNNNNNSPINDPSYNLSQVLLQQFL